MRPCLCEKDDCRLCWLNTNDERYRRLWEEQRYPAFLLNLKRRPDRLKTALAECERAGIRPTVIEAFDGRALPLPKNWKDGPGAYGCSLSHRAVMARIIQEGIPKALILEDDVTFVADFATKFNEFMAHVPPGWSAVMLGGQHIREASPVNDHVMRCNYTARTHAYIVRRDYAATLYGLWESDPRHVDHVWRDHMCDPGVNVYCPTHWLCGQAKGKSDINSKTWDTRFWEPKPLRPIKRRPCVGCGKAKE